MATGGLLPPGDLVRFVLDPDGNLTPDLAGKLPGRGAWVKPERAAIEAAVKKGAFSRALKGPAKLAEGMDDRALADAVEKGLVERLLSALGLARRAGKLISGFEKVAEALRKDDASLVVVARDAGEDGAAKILRLNRKAPVLKGVDAAALSAAIGESNVVYAAVRAGAECDRILREARRLSGFRPELLAAHDTNDTAGAVDQGRFGRYVPNGSQTGRLERGQTGA